MNIDKNNNLNNMLSGFFFLFILLTPIFRYYDLGFLAVKEGEEDKFKVFIGGGLGRNPKIGVEVEGLINPEDVVYHVEAMTSLFMAEGDYSNHGKARIRYIAERMYS